MTLLPNHTATIGLQTVPTPKIILFAMLFLIMALDAISAPVQTVRLQTHLRKHSFWGFTGPVKELVISGEVSGRCTATTVDIGKIIPASGLVAELDSTFVEIDLTKNRIGQERARRQLKQEQKSLARYTNLINKKSAAQATYDEVALRADVLKLTLQELRNEEKRLQELLKRYILHGPPGWQVIEKYVEPGEFVRVGQPVMKLGDFRTLLVSFQLTFEQLEVLKKVKQLSLFLPEIEKRLTASIYRVAPDFDETSRKIPVDFLLDSKTEVDKSSLRGGLKARLDFSQAGEQAIFEIPVTALLSRYEATWLVRKDGLAIRVVLLGKNRDKKMALITGENLNLMDEYQEFPDAKALDKSRSK